MQGENNNGFSIKWSLKITVVFRLEQVLRLSAQKQTNCLFVRRTPGLQVRHGGGGRVSCSTPLQPHQHRGHLTSHVSIHLKQGASLCRGARCMVILFFVKPQTRCHLCVSVFVAVFADIESWQTASWARLLPWRSPLTAMATLGLWQRMTAWSRSVRHLSYRLTDGVLLLNLFRLLLYFSTHDPLV